MGEVTLWGRMETWAKKLKLKPLLNAVINLMEAAVGEKRARLQVAGVVTEMWYLLLSGACSH